MKARKLFLFVGTLIAIVIAAGVLAVNYVNASLGKKLSHKHAGEIITVDQGVTLDMVLANLEKKEIIESSVPLRLYLRFTKIKPIIKAGDYRFSSPISSLEVLEVLEKGGIELNKLTVIEGWTRFEIAEAIARKPHLKTSKKQALLLMNNTKLIEDLDPVASNLEGYLYPDTYAIGSQTKTEDLIIQMVKRFRHVLKKIEQSAPRPKPSVHNAVTKASIIETEAKLPQERPVIASVINNRLKLGMPLAMDSTIVYASKSIGKWKGDGIIYQSDLDLRTPYNTRKHKGLPPGPVGSPGESSLRAAYNPAISSFLYYVREPSRNDGAHNFYSTPSQFEVGVAKLRQWEAQNRPQLNRR
jgi:UPF0755 protein